MKQSTTKEYGKRGLALLFSILLCTTLSACLPEDDDEKVTTEPPISTDMITTNSEGSSDVFATEDTTPSVTETTQPAQTTEPVTTTSCSHSWSKWTVTKNATCTENGTQTSQCTSCGKSKTETIQATGHRMNNETCEVCGYTTSCQHRESTWKVTKNATCTEAGSKNKICSSCSATLSTETVKPLGHDLTKHNAKAATCTAKGYAAYEDCSRCNYSTYKETAALGHDLTKHNAKAATCTAKGYAAYEDCSRCNYSTYKETAALGHKYVEGVCSACNSADPNYVPAMETITVPANQTASLLIDPITQSSTTIAPAEFITYQGNITKEGQVDTYTYTVLRDGRLRIDFSEVYAGKSFKLRVLNHLGENIIGYEYCYLGNDEGITFKDLVAGEIYQIEVYQHSGFSSYTMTLGQQKPTTDISKVTQVKDSIEFTDQRNVYTFTVPVDGRYRFSISGLKSGKNVQIMVFDNLGENIIGNDHYYLANGEGVTLKGLEAGETYKVQVRYHSGYGDYTLEIGKQKESTDISDYTEISDSIEFYDQRNVYTFTVPVDGRYRFSISGLKSGKNVQIMVFDDLGENIIGNDHYYLANGEGVTLKGLEAGKTYEVQVRYHSGYGDYTLKIGKQKPSVDVSSLVKVSDSIQYTDQRNIYNFVADVTGNHTLTISGMENSNVVELYVLNELDETVASDTYCKNGDSLVLKDLAIGTKYTILVIQKSGSGSYTLTIE